MWRAFQQRFNVPTVGEFYGSSEGNVALFNTCSPADLAAATRAFRESAFVRAAFGEAAVEHYAHFLDVEQDAYTKAVTDWERRRYFEQI